MFFTWNAQFAGKPQARRLLDDPEVRLIRHLEAQIALTCQLYLKHFPSSEMEFQNLVLLE